MSFINKILVSLVTLISLSSASSVQLEYTKAELLSEVKSITPGKPFWVVLKLTMRPNWHTYWLNPGDSGLETTIEWELPAGFTASPIQWLPPQRLTLGSLTNFGYNNESFHLVEITPPQDLAVQTQSLSAKASWLVCEETCIPEQADLTLTLPVSLEPTQPDYSEHQALFSQLRSELPKKVDIKGSYQLTDTEIIIEIPAAIIPGIKIAQLEFYPVTKGIIKNPAKQNWTLKNDKLQINIAKGLIAASGTQSGLLKITDATQNNTHSFNLEFSEPAVAASPQAPQSIWQILLFAMLGGLILNAMPCVFPVLSLKALSIAQQSGGSNSRVRLEGGLYTTGVLLSFIILAVLLLVLKYAGQTIGWGFQMQSPTFVAVMTYIMFLIGLSLSGLFYFPMLFANVGSQYSHHPGSSFWVGVLAVLVATPCTAPFMGVAIGYALSQSALVILMVFISSGIGFALPYLLISIFPPLLKILPKPGQWMETLKEFLAFPMYATAAWLLWVLTLQAGTQSLLMVSIGLVMSAFSIWWYQKLRLQNRAAKVIWVLIFGIISLWPFYYITALSSPASQSVEAFSMARLEQLRSRKEPVFVNATAAWCITCKVNEVTLKSQKITDFFKQKNINYLEADWTNQNSEITLYLSSFNRSGVPLYVYYPIDGEPVVLPQLLTPDLIKNALTKGEK